MGIREERGGVNNSLSISFFVENNTELYSLEHTVVSLSLSIKNYTHTHLYAQYQLMQSLIGAYFGQMDINDLINHTGARRGDITVTITSPHGTVSLLLPTRERDFVNAEELSWSFMSVLHWGDICRAPAGALQISLPSICSPNHTQLRQGI